MDPDATAQRRKHRLKRRRYQNPGPNYAWHIDGYDKLKHWGFPIHGAIDGFSRKILWLEVARSNNSPHKIASYYVRTASEQEKCPVELITDLGTENGLASAVQTFFRDNPDAHRYDASPRNQRIEGCWSFYSKVTLNGGEAFSMIWNFKEQWTLHLKWLWSVSGIVFTGFCKQSWMQ